MEAVAVREVIVTKLFKRELGTFSGLSHKRARPGLS